MADISLKKLDRYADATFYWLDGKVERVRVIAARTVGQPRTYVAWPESIRTVVIAGQIFTGERPRSWVDNSQLVLDEGVFG